MVKYTNLIVWITFYFILFYWGRETVLYWGTVCTSRTFPKFQTPCHLAQLPSMWTPLVSEVLCLSAGVFRTASKSQGKQVTDAISWSPCLLRICEGGAPGPASSTGSSQMILIHTKVWEPTLQDHFPIHKASTPKFLSSILHLRQMTHLLHPTLSPTPNTYCSFQCPTAVANFLRAEFIWCLILHSGSDMRCVAWTGLD